MAAAPTNPACQVCREPVASLQPTADHAECLLANGSKVRVSRFLGAHIFNGDEIAFPLFTSPVNRGIELYVTKNARSGHNRDLYQVPIGCVTSPQKNKREQLFVSAEVREGSLGISSVFFRCEVLRDYFYRIPRDGGASINGPFTMCCGLRLSLLPLNFASRTNCGPWSSIPLALLAANALPWSARSTSWLSQNSALVMTHS